jgi:hypothetical protein
MQDFDILDSVGSSSTTSSLPTSMTSGRSSVSPTLRQRLVNWLLGPLPRQGCSGSCGARSLVSTASDKLGPILIDALEYVYHCGPLSLQSDYARANSAAIAALASMNLITSLDSSGEPTRQWRITAEGIFAMRWEITEREV